MNSAWSTSDFAWWGGFTFLAVSILVRLMRQRRNEVLGELYAQVAEERARKQAQEAAVAAVAAAKAKAKAA